MTASSLSTEQRMHKTTDSLKVQFGKIRTGRASADLISHIIVDYYGSQTPLSQLATLSVIDSRTLGVSPWDKSAMAAVEKAIRSSDLGLNPMPFDDVIRVPIPPLTEERRKDYVKLARDEAEQARIAIRQIRRDANQATKNDLAEKLLSEDEAKGQDQQVQKATDHAIGVVDQLLKEKEQDIMSV